MRKLDTKYVLPMRSFYTAPMETEDLLTATVWERTAQDSQLLF